MAIDRTSIINRRFSFSSNVKYQQYIIGDSAPFYSTYTVFRARRITFFLVNRGAVWVRFGFQLGLRQWEALIIID